MPNNHCRFPAAFIAVATVAGLLAIGGCKSTHSGSAAGLSKHTIKVDDSYLGSWRSARGDVYTISRAGGDVLTISVKNADNLPASPFRGKVLDVNGTRFTEIDIADRSSVDAKAVPVFAYAKVAATLTSLEYTPIKADWFKAAVAGDPNAAYASAASVDPKAGGVVVKSPDAMFELLKRAAADAGAFGPSETLTRVP